MKREAWKVKNICKVLQNICVKSERKNQVDHTHQDVCRKEESVIQIQTFSALIGLSCHYRTSLETASLSEVCFWGSGCSAWRDAHSWGHQAAEEDWWEACVGNLLETEMVYPDYTHIPSLKELRNGYKLTGGRMQNHWIWWALLLKTGRKKRKKVTTL